MKVCFGFWFGDFACFLLEKCHLIFFLVISSCFFVDFSGGLKLPWYLGELFLCFQKAILKRKH